MNHDLLPTEQDKAVAEIKKLGGRAEFDAALHPDTSGKNGGTPRGRGGRRDDGNGRDSGGNAWPVVIAMGRGST